MKILLILCATVAMASAWLGNFFERSGTCPTPSSDVGACVITAENCFFDYECDYGQKCCSEGCGKKCRDTVETTRRNPCLENVFERPGTCPTPSSDVGACVITAENCFFDYECDYGQKCCSEGCGKKCRDTVETTRRNPVERRGRCPTPSNRFGACIFTPENCLNDSECGQGEKCCSDGCGKKCITVDSY